MDSIRFSTEDDESPASNHTVSLFVTIFVNEKKWTNILDMDEFFASLYNPGISPLFTCDCGIFGCGGYYIEVQHDHTSYKWINSYKPYDQWSKKNLIKPFEYSFSWKHIYLLGFELLELLEKIHQSDQTLGISSGVYGIDLVEKIKEYRNILTLINAKL